METKASSLPEPLPKTDRSVRRTLRALLEATRPKQATKNLFVFAALVFAGDLFKASLFLRALLAFLIFCITTGGVYLFNDIFDAERDRLHPQKRLRPIASGALPIPLAWTAVFCLEAVGGIAAFFINLRFGIAIVAYILLQVAYGLFLKQIVLLDVFALAAGFLLRTAGGGFAIQVGISPWLLLCTLELALFLGFGKRRQEIATLGPDAGKHRPILEEYSLPLLDQLIGLVVAMTLISYSVYAVESPSARSHPHLWATVPIVLYGLFRYLYLVYRKGWGSAPDEVLLQDRPLQITILLWFLLVLILFAFDGHTKGGLLGYLILQR